MYYRIEPSGTLAHQKYKKYDGLVQIRYDFFLEPEDYGYEKMYLYLPIITKPYPGKVDENGNYIDKDDYDGWLDSLPHEWVSTYFRSRLIRVLPSITDKEIQELGEAYLQASYVHWAGDETIFQNPPDVKPKVPNITYCLLRAEQVKLWLQ